MRRADPGHRRDDLLGQGTAKVLRLSTLRNQLADGAKDATALRADIASAIADIRAYASDVRGAASATQNAPPQQAALYQASEAARGSVNDFMRDYYDEHVFDRYLRFASVQDEEEYRRREQERHRAIDEARAEKTPQGDLRALDLSIDQLKDAGAHGARRSSEYQPLLDRMEGSRQQLAKQMAAAGQSQSHGTMPADSPTPSARPDAPDGKSSGATPQAPLPPEVLARLRAAQVSVADQSQEGHGVAARTGGGPDIRSL